MKYLYEISVKGRVQGVGYRYFVRSRAMELKLKGFVRNSYDGTVIIEAEGEREDLEVFIDYLRIGPPLARIDHVEIGRAPWTGMFEDFIIRH